MIKYTHKVTTTNEYGYGLNQPPGINSFSPETPYNTTTGDTAEFSIELTQNLQYINWTINGTLVQSNEEGNSATYTNTTSVAGNYTVNATGTNAQGTATQTWEWNVVQESTPPVSITSNQTSTGNFWINRCNFILL